MECWSEKGGGSKWDRSTCVCLNHTYLIFDKILRLAVKKPREIMWKILCTVMSFKLIH